MNDMAFTITYRTLFELNCWHHYYLDDETGNFLGLPLEKRMKILDTYRVSDFVHMYPTSDTIPILKGHQIIFKNTPKGMVLATKTDPADVNKMINPLLPETILRFILTTNDHSFFNYTNIRHTNRSLFYFSNNQPSDSAPPTLSAWASVFDAALADSMEDDGNPDTFAYPPGSMLVDALPDPKTLKIAREATNADFSDDTKWQKDFPGVVYDATANYKSGDRVMFTLAGIDSIYEAMEETTGNAPTDASKWAKIMDLPLRYVNENDLVPWIGDVFSHELSASGSSYRFDVSDALDQIVISKTRISETDGELFQLDMSHLPSGKYTIKVTDVLTDLVIEEVTGINIKSKDVAGKPVGLVEIVVSPLANSHKLLDGSHTLLSPAFELRFKNRSTVWQYFDSDESLVATSIHPKPLIKRGYQKITHDGVDLPNPEVGMIRPTPQQTYSQIFI